MLRVILIYFVINVLHLNQSIGLENKILFKINNISYTSFDINSRQVYLKFIGDEKIKNINEIINDFISVNLFREYNKKIFNDKYLESEIREIYNNIIEKRNNPEDINFNNEFKNNILINLKLDLNRKKILEEILNTKRNIIFSEEEEIDLLYNIEINYVSFKEEEEDSDIYNQLMNNNFNNIIKIQEFLNKNNINYFSKKTEINKINEVDANIKNKILTNERFFMIKKSNLISFFQITKKFETEEEIIAEIYSVEVSNKTKKENISCDNIENFDKNIYKINRKEYEYKKLNNKIKENLIQKNDFLIINNENKITYILLCNLKFNREILNNFNLNKKINKIVSRAESQFVKKYSEKFNLIYINE